jgi:predicted dehydrogenase
MGRPVTALVIGAGMRGRFTYGAQALAHPEVLRVVALAEPREEQRGLMALEHALAPEAVFRDWRDALARPRLADAAIVATGDTEHVEPTLAALERGYHVLLEKPMAPRAADCVRVVQAADRTGRVLQIGHVLRYTSFYARAHELVAEGRLGRLVHLALEEHVAAWHMAHSFVRGKFRNRQIAAPLLLAKSCHDLDLMTWFAGRAARRVASFGSLAGYRPENAPDGAPQRCSEACPVQASCPHDAVRFYAGPDEELARLWPWSDVSPDPSREARLRGLETGRYGRCVYRCDNDVVDHQVVAVEFDGGLSASFTVTGFAAVETRRLRLTGTDGELRGALDEGWLELARPGRFGTERFEFAPDAVGHYGGDTGLVARFADAVAREAPGEVLASGRSALESHLLGFAAERARETGSTVEMDAFRAEIAREAGADR